jgi:hypothetical protein
VFAGGFSKGLSPLADDNFVRLFFEGIVDQESKPDGLAALFAGAHLAESRGAFRSLPFVTARITRLFTLRASISPQFVGDWDIITRSLGRLPWADAPEEVARLIGSLAELLSTAQWFVQEQVLYFVHTLVFSQMFALDPSVYRQIQGQILRVYAHSDRAELRAAAIVVTRMAIPIAWDDFGVFFQELVKAERASDEKFAIANAVALIGAVVFVGKVPQWLPALFEFLEWAARKVRLYEKAINAACAAFWKSVGIREVPEIEDYRYAFSGQYFS